MQQAYQQYNTELMEIKATLANTLRNTSISDYFIGI